MALLEWRNTPTEGRDSTPAQRLLARRTRAAVPISLRKLVPEAQTGMWESKINQKKKIQAQNFKGRLLPALRIGQPVLVQDILANGAEADVYTGCRIGHTLSKQRADCFTEIVSCSDPQRISPVLRSYHLRKITYIPQEERLDPNTEEAGRGKPISWACRANATHNQ